jgi:alkanesulfonate monooxygenase SsuD/methylene tetrahydromethanopterin reductase-like flavin-dependent oxidoreductase (luciferase family)
VPPAAVIVGVVHHRRRTMEAAMRIGAILSPVADWAAVADAARAADEAGLDAIGLWDHYHSGRPDWAYVCGWSAYGALAAMTTRVRLVPMVLNNLHYEPGVLAKESSVLSIASGGRFELGLGGGDWPGSFEAWGRPFPAASERIERLVETIRALRLVWTGEPVDFDGRHIQLHGAICTPPPVAVPRVVVGVGASTRTLAAASAVADEVNVYDEPAIVETATRNRREGGPEVSVFTSWAWDKWPTDVTGELHRLDEQGVDRVFVSLGGPDMRQRIDALAAAGSGVSRVGADADREPLGTRA